MTVVKMHYHFPVNVVSFLLLISRHLLFVSGSTDQPHKYPDLPLVTETQP